MGGKVMRHVVFTEHLNMRPYMSDRHGDSINYRLYAVIVHEGASTTSGHYYCYVRAPNNIWHCMNDSYVSFCNSHGFCKLACSDILKLSSEYYHILIIMRKASVNGRSK